ncbi:MAG: chemotaxis protein CheW, partial [Candidatus Micrarchaeota archaeon]|nr:chemotaxis protein CheW [Candidatus Micrarchaeota archaeon]
MRQYIGFILEGSEYAVPIVHVQEIIKVPPVTTMPNSSTYVQGVSNLRGKIVPIINLKAILGKPDITPPGKVVVLVVGKLTFGVLIDEVTGVITVSNDQIDRGLDTVGEQIDGIAKVGDKLVVLLNEKKIIPNSDVSLLEDEIVEYRENGGKVEVVKKIETMGGEATFKETIDAKEFYEKYGIGKDDKRYAIVEDIRLFMGAVAENDFDKADNILNSLIQKGQADLFQEVGKV